MTIPNRTQIVITNVQAKSESDNGAVVLCRCETGFPFLGISKDLGRLSTGRWG
jgi:hypothetical protein